MQYIQANIIPNVEKTENVKYLMWTLNVLGAEVSLFLKKNAVDFSVEISYIDCKFKLLTPHWSMT